MKPELVKFESTEHGLGTVDLPSNNKAKVLHLGLSKGGKTLRTLEEYWITFETPSNTRIFNVSQS